MKLRLREDPREWQKFVLGAAVAPAAAGLVLFWRKVLPAAGLAVLLAALAVLLAACLARPRWFRGAYRRGMTLSFHIGRLVGMAVLTVLFFLLLTPLGLLLRLGGKDLLRTRRERDATSYWKPAAPPSRLDEMF
jgi:hypothetical protein